MNGPLSVTLKVFTLALVLMVAVACVPVTQPAVPQQDATERIVYVGPTLVDCEGEGPQKCMLVKEDPNEEYGLFYDTIEGFDFVEGNEFVLRVAETEVSNPPVGGSSLQWTLIEVIEETPVAAPLAGTLWSLQTYVNEDGEMVEVLPESEISIQFDEQGLYGNSGCNQFSGSYTSDGGTLDVAEPMASTMMACPDPLMMQERDFFAALGRVASYTIDENQLTLTDADGSALMVFAAVQPTSLTGTEWIVLSYNNGRGGVTSVLGGTSLSAMFTDTGELSGSAGCNNYTTTFETDGANLQIGPTATTRKMCAQPEGIMEQENAYLAALQMAATYAIEGDRLDLWAEDGSRLATFTAQSEPASSTGAMPEDSVVEALQNTVFQSEWTQSGTARLVNGEYREATAPGSATETVVKLTEHVAVGEVDGQPVAAAIIVTDPGGSGTFYDLALVIEQDGTPTNVANIRLGDRVEINSIAIDNGEIVVDMVMQGPNDPMCCPTQRVINQYGRQEGGLVETASEPQ